MERLKEINEEMVRIEMNIMKEQERIGELRKEAIELIRREFEGKYDIKSGDKITVTTKWNNCFNDMYVKTFDCFYIGFCYEYKHIFMVYADVKKDGTCSKNIHKTVSYNDYKIKKAL